MPRYPRDWITSMVAKYVGGDAVGAGCCCCCCFDFDSVDFVVGGVVDGGGWRKRRCGGRNWLWRLVWPLDELRRS